MNFYDWQAYDAGALSAEETSRHESALRNDPEARAELEGLRAFVARVRSAGLSDVVPHARLAGMSTNAHPPRKRTPLYLTVGLTAAAAALLAFWVAPRMEGPVAAPHSLAATRKIRTSDPVEARQWLVSNTSRPAPTLTLGRCSGKLLGVAYDKECMEWDVSMDGLRYSVVGTASSHGPLTCTSHEFDGQDFLVDGERIGWRCVGGMVYFVSGGTHRGRLKLATAARLETPSLRRI